MISKTCKLPFQKTFKFSAVSIRELLLRKKLVFNRFVIFEIIKNSRKNCLLVDRFSFDYESTVISNVKLSRTNKSKLEKMK